MVLNGFLGFSVDGVIVRDEIHFSIRKLLFFICYNYCCLLQVMWVVGYIFIIELTLGFKLNLLIKIRYYSWEINYIRSYRIYQDQTMDQTKIK